MSNVTTGRLVVFDFIRLIAILLVVFSHTLKVGDLPFDVTLLGKIGNAVFFFISGYLIYLNNSNFKSKPDILRFYKKRILRIYPLYILAIVCGLLLSILLSGHITQSFFEVIVSILGLQMVFYPVLVHDPIILWFIGMIVIFYIIYPVVMYLSAGNIRKYIIYSSLVIGILVLIKLFTGFIGGGVFEYYFVFVAGVIVAWTQLFNSQYIKKVNTLAIIAFICSSVITLIFQPSIGELEHVPLTLSIIINVGLVMLLRLVHGISTVFVLYVIYSYLTPGKCINKIIVNGAFASYAVYLFHGNILSIINIVVSSCGDFVVSFLSLPLIYDIVLIIIFIPIIFIISYYIQKGESICIKKVKQLLK